MLDRRSKGGMLVSMERYHTTPKTKAVNQIKGDRHVVWIDRNNLVVHLRVVHFTVGKNLAGVDVEGDHGRVVNHASGIKCEYLQRDYSLIPNRSRSERF